MSIVAHVEPPSMGEHDALFKRIFGVPSNAAGELASVLPTEVLAAVDLDQLELVPGSFVDEAMAQRHTDLLFRAPRRVASEVHAAHLYFYFLFEHLSRTDLLAPFRVLRYETDIWSWLLQEDPNRKTLPPIITVVVHHGPGGWRGPRSLHEMIEGLHELPALRSFLPNVELLIDDLALASDEELQRRPLPPVPRVAVWLLRDARDVDTLLAHVSAWAAALTQAAYTDPREVTVLFRYLLSIAGQDAWQRVSRVIIEQAPTTEAPMISAADHLIQQGLERGLQQGREQGIQQGQLAALRDVLRSVLVERFGGIPLELDAQIDARERNDLQRAVVRAVSAARPEDVFGER